VKSTNFLRYR